MTFVSVLTPYAAFFLACVACVGIYEWCNNDR